MADQGALSTDLLNVTNITNIICAIVLPFGMIKKVFHKSNTNYENSRREDDEKKIKEKKLVKGLLMSWTNIFMISRIVENISYVRFTYLLIFQPLHFLINTITLIIIVCLDHSTNVSAIAASVAVTGFLNSALLFWTYHHHHPDTLPGDAGTDLVLSSPMSSAYAYSTSEEERYLNGGIYTEKKVFISTTTHQFKQVKKETRSQVKLTIR